MTQDLNANSTQRPAVESESFASDRQTKPDVSVDITKAPASNDEPRRPLSKKQKITESLQKTKDALYQYAKFIGPGFMVAVAYIDPGNYATDVAAGASFRFALLFVILMSNMFAIFLQSLSVKLGTVTGKNLAENSREHLPKWMNIVIYVLAEVAIIATDVAEVIGFSIALNVLGNVPLVAGCAISIVDVLIILLFYNPSGSTKAVRMFEYFVMLLVLGVVFCFCFQLSLIKNTSFGEVIRGYLPSKAVVQSEGLYQACGILGATVMPHSLYLGSGLVQPRLREFDRQLSAANGEKPDNSSTDSVAAAEYRPSVQAIKTCLNFSVVETAVSLFTFALFVNSAILIVAGASLFNTPGAGDADLFGIHDLLSSTVAPAAGTIFALALLLSGVSAGIVCTIAGQMVSEGSLRWTIKPWIRRMITRSISITPSIIIAGAVGRSGLSAALVASQVCLSVILPFVSAPLIYFTCRDRFMTISAVHSPGDNLARDETGDNMSEKEVKTEDVKMTNSRFTSVSALVIWLVIVVMNVTLLVLIGLGKA
ncbi:Natural resistance-associated macrophage protein [Neofusicoccum parvum]|uniref:Natural resistance-associated macrophage protein n=1 Tax=Neofusicoccum parvum TaxID=310453 RepID=A0ACB5SEV3_9PEZI|nr:Natural resistance-associated macrophage protein [Neofusicoccum parvum]